MITFPLFPPLYLGITCVGKIGRGEITLDQNNLRRLLGDSESWAGPPEGVLETRGKGSGTVLLNYHSRYTPIHENFHSLKMCL